MNTFDEADAASIKLANAMFEDPTVKTELAYIRTNFTMLISATVKFETQGLSLVENLETMKMIVDSLNSLDRKEFSNKMQMILLRNRGYNNIVEIGNILQRSINPSTEYVQKLTPLEIASFKYCPISSADVERSFSRYGNVLTYNRHRFLFENLKQHMIVHCNGQ